MLNLLGLGGPAAILGLIVPVIVVPFDRVTLGWAWPHIGKEGSKVIAPTGADANTSAAIISIAGGIGVLTAGDHAGPGPVLRANLGLSVHSARMPMSDLGSKHFKLETPTGARIPAKERRSADSSENAACAAAKPMTAVTSRLIGPSNDRKTLKDSARQIVARSGHNES